MRECDHKSLVIILVNIVINQLLWSLIKDLNGFVRVVFHYLPKVDKPLVYFTPAFFRWMEIITVENCIVIHKIIRAVLL